MPHAAKSDKIMEKYFIFRDNAIKRDDDTIKRYEKQRDRKIARLKKRQKNLKVPSYRFLPFWVLMLCFTSIILFTIEVTTNIIMNTFGQLDGIQLFLVYGIVLALMTVLLTFTASWLYDSLNAKKIPVLDIKIENAKNEFQKKVKEVKARYMKEHCAYLDQHIIPLLKDLERDRFSNQKPISSVAAVLLDEIEKQIAALDHGKYIELLNLEFVFCVHNQCVKYGRNTISLNQKGISDLNGYFQQAALAQCIGDIMESELRRSYPNANINCRFFLDRDSCGHVRVLYEEKNPFYTPPTH